jgi:hypothetical protein
MFLKKLFPIIAILKDEIIISNFPKNMDYRLAL